MLAFLCGGILKYDVCWGFIDTSAHAIVDSLTGFVLSPNFYCEEVAMVCETKEFKFSDPNDYVRRILNDKPEFVNDDNYLNSLYDQVT